MVKSQSFHIFIAKFHEISIRFPKKWSKIRGYPFSSSIWKRDLPVFLPSKATSFHGIFHLFHASTAPSALMPSTRTTSGDFFRKSSYNKDMCMYIQHMYIFICIYIAGYCLRLYYIIYIYDYILYMYIIPYFLGYIYIYMYIYIYPIGGWPAPRKKYDSQLWWLFPIYGKK